MHVCEYCGLYISTQNSTTCSIFDLDQIASLGKMEMQRSLNDATANRASG